MNKKRTQVLLMITVLISMSSMVILFEIYNYTSIKNQLISQIVEDNRSMGEHLFQLLNDELYFEKSQDQQIAFLQKFSNQISLPNGGFVCALSHGGDVVAFPGLEKGHSMNIGNLVIHDVSNVYEGTLNQLKSGIHFSGILSEPDGTDQIIYSRPLGNTPLRLNVHQKMDSIHERIKTILMPSLIIGLLLSVFTSLTVFIISNRIVYRYESRLEHLNRDLMEVSSERKQLLRVISHDLSNPLAAISMSAELSELEDHTEEDFLETLKGIRYSARQAAKIIALNREMLALEDKKRDLPLQVVSLQQSVFDVENLLKHRLEDKKISLKYDFTTDFLVRVEPVSFVNSVLNNILSNAVKFSFPNSTIEIDAKRTENMTDISITDKGIGMSPELIDKLFHVHEYTHRKGTGNESGTGYGMPIMKRFMELYGGTVKVESEEGKEDARVHGTTFHLIVPSV